jgi:copper chaperone CopZ
MKQVFDIKGMHCRSCELLIEENIAEVPGVRKVFASTKRAQVTVYGEDYKNGQIIEPRKPEQFTDKITMPRAKWLKQDGIKIIISTLPKEDYYDIPIDMNLVIQFYSR